MRKRVVIFDSEQPDSQKEIKEAEAIEELDGKLSKQDEENKLMHSVLECDKDTIDDGKLLSESFNQSIGSFTPSMIFQNLVTNFKIAKHLYGETILREISGYDPKYIERNLRDPEFRKELEKNIGENIRKLQKKGYVDKDGFVTEKGITLSSLVLYTEELNNLIPKGFGEKREKKRSLYGDREDYDSFKKSRYRDIAIRQSVKTAIRRKHEKLEIPDLKIFQRRKKGKISIVYALDSSGSMRGDKIKTAKKAGIALAFKAIQEKNNVGLIVFGSDIKNVVEPTQDFGLLLRELTIIKAAMETDIAKTIEKSLELFPQTKVTKHLVILTDAMPTKGKKPEEETLYAVSIAREEGVTISLIGIDLDDKGEKLARRMTEIGNGKLYKVKDLAEIDKVILEDYDSL
ncbi:MAG: VWA domain-containing protein [archaeon]